MKYLFFDLECSNCFNAVGKVCEFGAILTDDKFNIVEEFSIPMNPGKDGRFDLSIYDRDPGFDWAYSRDYYFSCPEFNMFYHKIKSLMENEETIVFGYAVDNDIRYLYDSCRRYNLEPISYNAYDIRIIKKQYSNKKQLVGGLKGAFLDFCDYTECLNLTPHLAKDDSKMTMIVLKSICENTKMNVEEILSICNDSYLNSIEYINYYNRKKNNLGGFTNESKKRIKAECNKTWNSFYKRYLGKEENGKTVSISCKLLRNIDTLNMVISTIQRKQLIASNRTFDSNYVIVLDEDDKKRLENNFQHPYSGEIVLLNDFINEKEDEQQC